MLEDTVKERMQPMFGDSNTYQNHVQHMKENGTWGTEQEIIAAAHLFNCSIICLANGTDFYLQHFPPHFLTNAECNSSCSHMALYITNPTGNHFNQASVTLYDNAEE